MSDRTMFIVWR